MYSGPRIVRMRVRMRRVPHLKLKAGPGIYGEERSVRISALLLLLRTTSTGTTTTTAASSNIVVTEIL